MLDRYKFAPLSDPYICMCIYKCGCVAANLNCYKCAVYFKLVRLS